LTFTVPASDYHRATDLIMLKNRRHDRVDGATDVAKVSVIGIGMRSHAGVAAQASRRCREGINIRAIPHPRSSSRC
jgi:aspartate kinase